MNNFYTYVHYRLDNDDPFYVGKGCDDRAYEKTRRNSWWYNIANKHGYRVEFLRQNLTEDQAFALEVFFIKTFGRTDLGEGTLVNLTNGGEGSSGSMHLEKTKQLLSEQKMGENNPNFGKPLPEIHRQRIAISGIGNKNSLGRRDSEETKTKKKVAALKREQMKRDNRP